MTQAVPSTPLPLPDHHVARPALVRRVREHPVTVVEAAGGWGKSTLSSEVAAAHRGEIGWSTVADVTTPEDAIALLLEPVGLGGLTPAGPEEWLDLPGRLAEALRRRRRPHLLIVDDITPAVLPAVVAAADAVGLVNDGLPAPQRSQLLALGRRAGSDIGRPDWLWLRRHDLALQVEEFELLLGQLVPGGLSAGLGRLLVDRTEGWCAVLRSIAGALATSPTPDELARHLLQDNAPLERVVSGMVAKLDPGARQAAGVAAGLPVLDATIAERLALDDAVVAAVRAGVPWETPRIGPWSLPDPVQALLTRSPVSPEIVELVVEVYSDAKLHLEAARYAMDHGRRELAAATLAKAPAQELARAFKPTVLAVLRSFDTDLTDAYPMLHVQVARLLTASARYAERNTHVEQRAAQLEARHPGVAAALQAERFRDLAYFSPTPDPADIATIERLLSGVDDLATRSRLEQGLALLLARRDGVAAAEAGLRRAAEAAERAGDLNQAALVLRDLAWVVLLELGRLRQVVETFDRIEVMLGPDTPTTAWRINRAEALVWLGDLEAAEQDLDTASRLAEVHHDDQHVAYAAWARATLESMRGRPLATLAAVQRAEAVAGDWISTVTGVMFYAQTADALSRVGLQVDARSRLERAQSRRTEDPRPVDVAEFGLEARLGDPERARELGAALDLDQQEPFDVPRIMLLRAYAGHRAGQDTTDAAGRAFAAYAAANLLDAAPVAEADACAALIPLVRAVGGVVPEVPEGAASRRSEPLSVPDLTALLTTRHGLRPREAEVVLALRTGGSNAEIATSLGISAATVRKHLQHAYATLDVRSRTEALVLLNTLS